MPTYVFDKTPALKVTDLTGAGGTIVVRSGTGPAGVPGQIAVRSGTGPVGPPGMDASTVRLFYGSSTGPQTVTSGKSRLTNLSGGTLTISKVRVDLGAGPVGGSFVLDVKKNGTSIFTAPMTLLAGATAGTSTAIVSPTWADGQYLTFDVLAVGPTTPGSDLSLTLVAS